MNFLLFAFYVMVVVNVYDFHIGNDFGVMFSAVLAIIYYSAMKISEFFDETV